MIDEPPLSRTDHHLCLLAARPTLAQRQLSRGGRLAVRLAEALVLGSGAASAGVPAGGRRRARALLREAENEVLAEADEADLRLEQAVIDIEGGPFGMSDRSVSR